MDRIARETPLERHENAAAETLAQAWANGVTVPQSLTESLLGLARAWDAIERADGPYSALPNIAREVRTIVDRLAPTTHATPGHDPWDEIASQLR